MRDLKTLWTLVLLEAETFGFDFGICQLVNRLFKDQYFNIEEYNKIHDDIESNAPYNRNYFNGAYYWAIGDYESRIEFIKERIKQHSK